MSVIYSWVSFEYHLQYQLGYLGCHFECHYIISLYLTLTSLYLTLSHLNLTLQVTPLLTKMKSHEIIIFYKKNII